jgi:hypothetical protein
MRDRLLLHGGKLVVPNNGDLRARLLNEIYRQLATTYLGIDKTAKLLSTRYY